MLSEEDFKYKILQQHITFLTEENLDKLETHCRKAVNFERGFEHKVVLELLERYYQYQKEIRSKNNNITKLEKQNKEKDKEIEKYKYLYQKALDNTISADGENMKLKKQIDLMAEYIGQDMMCIRPEIECNKMTHDCKDCVKKSFERKSEEC